MQGSRAQLLTNVLKPLAEALHGGCQRHFYFMDDKPMFAGIDGESQQRVETVSHAGSILTRCETPEQLDTFYKLNKTLIDSSTLCKHYYRSRKAYLNTKPK